jgi:hypothetical protein
MLYRKVPVMAGNPVFIPGPPETAQAMQDWLKEYLPLLAPDVEPQVALKGPIAPRTCNGAHHCINV